MSKNKVWKVKTVGEKGAANDSSTDYGKLFKAGRLIYLWTQGSSDTEYNGIGVLKYPKSIKPSEGDTIEVADRRFVVLNVEPGTMSSVYCKKVSVVKKTIARPKVMTNEQLAKEIRKLHEAVDTFAVKMRTRLAQKARAGYLGWDDNKDGSRLAIENKLVTKMQAFVVCKATKKTFVDIANLALMLELRAKEDAE